MKLKFPIIIIILCFLFEGCLLTARQARKSDFYTLEYEQPETDKKEKLPYSLRIERFQISPLYDTDKIVFREKKFLRNNYNYHKWRTSPRDLITYYLTRDIRGSNLFKAVFSYENPYQSSHIISGTVDEIYEYDGTIWEAVLSLNIVLLKENEPDVSKRIVFQKSYTERKPCREKNPIAVVEAMGNAMSGLSKKITNDIYLHLLKSN